MDSSLYLSVYKFGKAFHFVKASPFRAETIKQQVPGGFCFVIDEVIENEEGTWGRLNPITLAQFDIGIPQPVYICIKVNGNAILFNKVYGN